MRLSFAFASLAGLFMTTNAIPIWRDGVYIDEMDAKSVQKTLNKRDDYYDHEKSRNSRYYDDYYNGRYNERRYSNPNYYRDPYDYREPAMAANSRMYPPQYYPQANTGNVYSDADIQNYIAAAAAAAAAAATSSSTMTSANPATPAIAAPASGTDSLAYQALLASSDPSTLFNSYQSTTLNTQPVSPFTFPGFASVANTVAGPSTAENPPPKAQLV